MQRIIAIILCVLFTSTNSHAANKKWLQVDLGIIGAASYEILARADKEVEEKSYQGLILKVDSPGGTLGATKSSA